MPTQPVPTSLPNPSIETATVTVYHGDAIQLLPRLTPESCDALITDPPYGLSFNGHSWDGTEGFLESLPDRDPVGLSGPEIFEAWCTAWAAAALPALKPGAYAAVFGGTRMWHRMVRGMENAGFEIRDQIAWLHGAGMPKSMDISYAIDKYLGHARSDRSVQPSKHEGVLGTTREVLHPGSPVSVAARQWSGWGTALRPVFEPIIIARKPLDGTTAHNTVAHGVGGINVEAGRFGEGKWPTNTALDTQQATLLDALTGTMEDHAPTSARFPVFHYHPKAQAGERPRAYGISHDTVKPIGLMEWLIRLFTPTAGVVLEPFAGSGTTIAAAQNRGCRVVAFEKDSSFVPLLASRLEP